MVKVDDSTKGLLAKYKILLLTLALTAASLLTFLCFNMLSKNGLSKETPKPDSSKVLAFKKPVWELMPMEAVVYEKDPELIRYGKKLIANTALYLGPKGSVKAISNGMNCQNCHIDAGTRPWGNNYGAVRATYPKFRERSGSVENIYKRINDCIERSLNGKALDTASHEMQAMAAYITFLGKYVPKDSIPLGTGIWKLKSLSRAADPEKGRTAYAIKCESCHGKNGEGLKSPNAPEYTYPPLWGSLSYNTGAGLYRLSRFAGYIKTNMPYGVTYKNPNLSDEEAWDIAAYVNSKPRPIKDLSKDWPNLAGKPSDHPFGPYVDPFDEKQHKYGPFKPVDDWKKAQKNKKTI
jgi:thiosulfate dehydrogenase